MMRRMVLAAAVALLSVSSAVFAQKQLVIGEIKIEGNKKTDARVILTEMWLESGDSYSKEKVEEARRNIMNLRFFKSVAIKEDVQEAAGVVNLTVTVAERITWGVTPIANLDGDEPDNNEFGLTVTENNLLGYGKSVSLSGSATENASVYSLTVTDPQVMYSRFTAGVGATSASYSDMWDVANLDDDVFEGYIQGGYRPTYETDVYLKATFREDDMSLPAGTVYTIDESTTEIALGLSYNDTYYKIDTITGLGASLYVQNGTGDNNYNRSTLSLYYSRTIYKNHWLRLSASGGALSESDIWFENFGVGGGATIRGYSPSYRTGDRYALVSAQYEAPVWRPAAFGLSGTVSLVGFLDTGDAWVEDDDSAEFITGAGVGVRAYVNELQALTFSFDLGYGFEEEEFQPHLSFGGSF